MADKELQRFINIFEASTTYSLEELSRLVDKFEKTIPAFNSDEDYGKWLDSFGPDADTVDSYAGIGADHLHYNQDKDDVKRFIEIMILNTEKAAATDGEPDSNEEALNAFEEALTSAGFEVSISIDDVVITHPEYPTINMKIVNNGY
jgi:hypothetical protein